MMLESVEEAYLKILKTPGALPKDAAMRSVYYDYPMTGFYQYKSKVTYPIRIFGVMKYADGSLGVHAVTAHLGWCNIVIDGLPVSDIERVDAWSEGHMQFINTLTEHQRLLFLNPNGWMNYAAQESKE